VTCRVTRRGCCAWSAGCGLFGVEGEDPRWQRDVEGGVQPANLGAGLGGLAEQPGRAGEGADVQALELVAGAGPGGVGAGFHDAGQQQCEPAEHDVGADAVFEPVIDRPQVQDLLHVAPAALDLEELLVAQRDVLRGQVWVAGAQQVLPVQARVGGDLRGVEA
jgi:hypothetical protein